MSCRIALGSVLLLTAACTQSPAAGNGTARRVVYRVEDLTQVPERVTTEVVEVVGPYRARELNAVGAPPGGASLGGLAWDEGTDYLVAPTGSVQVVASVAPGFAGPDTHLEVALPSAQRHGLATKAGERRVAGMSCTDWVTHDPLDSGPLGLAAGGDRTVSCVAADGLLLYDEWSLGGHVVRRRTAVEVGKGADLSGLRLLGGRPAAPATVTAPEQVMSVPLSRLVTALGIPTPALPVGLPFDRGTAVIQRGTTGQVDVEGGVLAWTRGEKLVVLRLERGLTRSLQVPDQGVLIRLSASRTVRLEAVPSGLQVRFAGGNGLVATVTADVDEDELLRWIAVLDLG